MRVAARTDVGHVRQRNEDALLVPADGGAEPPVVVAVADGMGGHPAGDVASRLAVEILTSQLTAAPDVLAEPQTAIATALESAHHEIGADAAANPERTGMGTTAVVAVVQPDAAWVGHVGDSRAYLVRAGVSHRLTRDHSRHGFITQALGLGVVLTPEISEVPLEPGDRLLLCTDGLTGLVHDQALAALAADGDLESATDALVDTALVLGGHDNVTVVMVEV